jgi:hypothetical protein
MSTKTVSEEAREILAREAAAKTDDTFRAHVKKCPECVVDDEGIVWACDVGASIRQRERKARL